jgi:hypothetical protein
VKKQAWNARHCKGAVRFQLGLVAVRRPVRDPHGNLQAGKRPELDQGRRPAFFILLAGFPLQRRTHAFYNTFISEIPSPLPFIAPGCLQEAVRRGE